MSVADPEFSVEGRQPHRGHQLPTDIATFHKICIYVKTTELGPRESDNVCAYLSTDKKSNLSVRSMKIVARMIIRQIDIHTIRSSDWVT